MYAKIELDKEKIMYKSKMFRVYEPAEKVIIKETSRRISITGRPHSKQAVLNDMVLEYAQMLKRLKELNK